MIADDAHVHDYRRDHGQRIQRQQTIRMFVVAYLSRSTRLMCAGQSCGLTSDDGSGSKRWRRSASLDDGLSFRPPSVTSCGGSPSESSDPRSTRQLRRAAAYDPAQTEKLAGVVLDGAQQRAILEKLGFGVAADWTITVPTYGGVTSMAQRTSSKWSSWGLNGPSTPLAAPGVVAKPTATPEQDDRAPCAAAAAASGFQTINWSFIPKEAASVQRRRLDSYKSDQRRP